MMNRQKKSKGFIYTEKHEWNVW